MTSVAPSASKQYAMPGVWSFNHRVGGGYSSDPESEAETNGPSDDTRALQEMDLSSRQETVEYRPNPWSIAKINAVSRASLPRLTQDKPRARTPPKPPTKRIMEALKKQAARNARPIQHKVARDVGEGKAPRVSFVPLQSRGIPEEKLPCEDSRMVSRNPMSAPRNKACVRPAEPWNRRSLRAAAPIQFSKVPQQQKSTHISTSAQSVQSENNGTLPFMFRHIFGTREPYPHHLVTQSSPVRPSCIAGSGRDLPMYPRSSPGLLSPVSAHEFGGTYVRPSLLPSLASVIATNSQAAKVVNKYTHHTRLSSTMADSPRCTGATAMPRWLSAALSQENDPPSAPVPEADRKRLPSPMLAPRSKKPRPDAPRDLAPATPSAYTFGVDDDPDSKWSTLPQARRRVSTAKRGVKQSGGFRLPIPGLRKGNESRPVPDVRQRVITYLPPPMTANKSELVNDTTLTPTNDDHKLTGTAGDLLPTDPTRRHRCDAGIGELASKGDPAEEEDAEIPTMDSDGVTLVNDDDAEPVFAFDVDDVCARYPTTRAYMKEERRLWKQLGCILELASCRGL
ncbi:hypothetical protein PAXRUDRAFT_669987 [Paxillus rubicundulus Ve08.2h10]|uniref:Uncharacterized protein n=1 Tax=Paxillus rubicundulus Ve08.2h10 TaxID=930991 RepID=A0A0D0DRV5_9AGAM|nr:hypothetical protein PAXRUDRAFT_669987 [Paxillus rubicundulus Ve08.2h10]